MFDQRMGILNEEISLIKQHEKMMDSKIDVLNKDKNPKTKHSINKDNNWPFSSYESCFILKTLPIFRLFCPQLLFDLTLKG